MVGMWSSSSPTTCSCRARATWPRRAASAARSGTSRRPDVRVPGFHFRETMSGTYERDDGVARAMRFTVTARAESMLGYLRDRKARLDGEVTMEGFATAKPLDGEITIDPLLGKLIRYEFAFAADDGQRYRFVGQKDVTI